MDNKGTVCDICGDARRDRDGLSICCKCPSGAEHNYCMRSELDNAVLHKDLSSKKFTGKAKSKNDVTSELQISCISQEKAKVPHAFGDKRRGKRRAGETTTTFPKTSKPKNQSLVKKKPSLKKLEKRTVVLALPVCFVEQSSSRKKPKVILPKLVLKDMNSAETKTVEGNSAESAVTTGKSKSKTISHDEVFSSGSNGYGLDAVQSCGHLDCRLQPNSEASAAIKMDRLCTSLGSDEYSKFEAASLLKDVFIPEKDYIWQGKFQIHRSEGTASTCDGIQAHLSTHAAQEVSEEVGSFPDVIVLEELPRMSMWSTQFMKSEATEESIALYFFAKDLNSYGSYYKGLVECMTKNDLALKGNLNGFELFIFSSIVLPKKSQRWNTFLFLWGVFKGRKINNLANTPLSTSAKCENGNIVSCQPMDLTVYPEVLQQENRDIVRSLAFDLNAYPEDEND